MVDWGESLEMGVDTWSRSMSESETFKEQEIIARQKFHFEIIKWNKVMAITNTLASLCREPLDKGHFSSIQNAHCPIFHAIQWSNKGLTVQRTLSIKDAL